MIMRVTVVIIFSLLVCGCATIGPDAIPRDRFDYNKAVSDSWKEQTLLNIVKVRYADMPLFMEVVSIISGYSLETAVSISGTTIEGGNSPNSLSLGGSGKYTDRPTITYAPITGEKFNKNFMTPVPPAAILFLMQSGWSADIVLPITLEAINGLRASKSAGAGQRAGDAKYYRVIQLFKQIQRSGAIGLRVVDNAKGNNSTVLVIRRTNVPAEALAAGEELADLLGMRRGAQEYSVVYAEVAQNDTEVAMLTRSMLSIMVELAGEVAVPEKHIREGRTVPSLIANKLSSDEVTHRLIDIRHSDKKPEDAFAAVKYRENWYWISDRDFKSKRTLAYLMLLFSLTESGAKEGLPLVTIPAS